MAPARIIEDNGNVGDNTFDFIVCGGGTSGCVLAGRLAEDTNARILVLEAGPDSADLDNVHMPGGWSNNFDSETDWNIVTEPMHACDDRRVKCSRGRLLGGSSGVNGTLCIRGTKQDYDDWGLEGWSGEEVFKYMKKAETFHPNPVLKESTKLHGTDGPLHTTPHELAPISKLFIESLESQGVPYHGDMFTTGEQPHGCGDVVRTVYKGLRSTGADFITKGYKRDNVTIVTDATVDKIIIEGEGETQKATGVNVIGKDGTKHTFNATKEIIVSAGAYCSPAILLRSGIGPKDEVEKHGIKSVVDAPGVGQNLQDHVLCFLFYEVNKDGLTNDSKVYHSATAVADQLNLWKEKREGVLSTFPFGAFAYARLDDRLADSELWRNAPRRSGRDPMGLAPNQPNIEIWNTELYGGPKQYVDFPIDGSHVLGACTLLFTQQSRGSVKLSSADPLQNPIVDHNYLGHELDMLVLAEACKFTNEIVLNGAGTKDIVNGSWPPNHAHHTFKTREDWIPYVKENSTTCYHASGTCKMGKPDDPLAVLDEKLRVKGVQGLRVADVSIMPVVNNGHTQMPAYAIGEKAADLIKEGS